MITSVKDRTGYIGGSDWGAIFDLPPYGCKRRCWYEKRGQEPDFPKEVSAAMERGTRLEGVAADLYAERTGRKIVPPGFIRANGLPEWWGGHPDRFISDPEGHPGMLGVLEVKTAGQFVFRTFKADTLPESYVLQVQHYLALTGCMWGAFAVLWPDGWELLHFDIKRHDELISSMRTAGELFWRSVTEGPDPVRLDAEDRRCRSCPFRHTCQGVALDSAPSKDGGAAVELAADSELEDLVHQFAELKDVADEAESEIQCIRDRVRNRLKSIGHSRVKGPWGRVYDIEVKSNRLDATRLKKELPDVAKKYSHDTVSRQLRISTL